MGRTSTTASSWARRWAALVACARLLRATLFSLGKQLVDWQKQHHQYHQRARGWAGCLLAQIGGWVDEPAACPTCMRVPR